MSLSLRVRSRAIIWAGSVGRYSGAPRAPAADDRITAAIVVAQPSGRGQVTGSKSPPKVFATRRIPLVR